MSGSLDVECSTANRLTNPVACTACLVRVEMPSVDCACLRLRCGEQPDGRPVLPRHVSDIDSPSGLDSSHTSYVFALVIQRSSDPCRSPPCVHSGTQPSLRRCCYCCCGWRSRDRTDGPIHAQFHDVIPSFVDEMCDIVAGGERLSLRTF